MQALGWCYRRLDWGPSNVGGQVVDEHNGYARLKNPVIHWLNYRENRLQLNQHQPVTRLTEDEDHLAQSCPQTPQERTANGFQREHVIGSDHGTCEIAGEPEKGLGSGRKHVAYILLASYSLYLAYRALRHGEGGVMANTPVWELQDSRRLLGWMSGLAFVGFCEFAYFVPVGFLAAMITPRGLGWSRRLPIDVPALAVASVLAALVQLVETAGSWNLILMVSLAIPLLGCLFGTWIGTTWVRGWRSRLWLLPKIALLACLVVLCMAAIVWLSLEPSPLPFEAARVTSAEKRRLTQLIRGKNPRSLQEGQTQTLRLTEHDVNVLLSWGLSLGSPERKARVSLARDSASLSMSVGVPFSRGGSLYLNLVTTGGAAIEDGVLSLEVDRCRLGVLEVPGWLLKALSPVVASLLSHERRSRPFLDAVRRVSIEPGSIELTYGRLRLPPGFREDLFGPCVASEEVLASVQAQVDQLLAVARQSPRSPPSFGLCLETAFALARNRSAERDPVSENQAGILALGMLLGHPRVEELVGPVLAGRDTGNTRGLLNRVALRGRSDWTKHFCVSAAIAVLSNGTISDAAGLLKEELDADIGGSGFSFGDLLADRAGTTFAMQATRDKTAARAMQDRLANGFRVDEFFPEAADLPEGIPDAELQSRYGGVSGEGYRRVVEDIEQRIAACPAYR